MGPENRSFFLRDLRTVTAALLKAATGFLVLMALLLWADSLFAKVFATREEALARTFPGLEIKKESVFLDEKEMADIERASGVRPASKLFTYYSAIGKDGGIAGFAVMESHMVRTKPEVYMAVVRPDGTLKSVEILAFYEPPEYMPSKRWLEQFSGKTLSERLWINRDIQAISGATLSSYGLTREVRKALASIEVIARRNKKR